MAQDILFATWFLLPAAMANVAPVFAAAIPQLKKYDMPIDGGKKWRGKEILGSHKTWRGIISGIIAATLTLWLQQILFERFDWAKYASANLNYSELPLLILGPAFAIGALGGDAIKSFFKRRFSIKSGESWPPFDQLDYIIGSILITLPFAVLSISQYLWIVIIWFVTHLVVSFIGYKIGLKDAPI